MGLSGRCKHDRCTQCCPAARLCSCDASSRCSPVFRCSPELDALRHLTSTSRPFLHQNADIWLHDEIRLACSHCQRCTLAIFGHPLPFAPAYLVLHTTAQKTICIPQLGAQCNGATAGLFTKRAAAVSAPGMGGSAYGELHHDFGALRHHQGPEGQRVRRDRRDQRACAGGAEN